LACNRKNLPKINHDAGCTHGAREANCGKVLIFLAFARRPKRGFRVADASKKFLAPEFLLTEPRRVPLYSHQLSENKALFLRGSRDF
jgi:hypothetical protein